MKRIIFSLLILTVTFNLFSCGGAGPDDSEIRITVQRLIEKATPLNEIYFGEGLPCDILRAGVGKYKYISSDGLYKSIEDIKEATREVFSEEYSNLLFSIAFSATNEEGIGINYARYAEENGELLINSESECLISTTRTYHFDTLEVSKKNNKNIIVDINTEDDSGGAAIVRLKLVNENGKWLLDSPTY